MEAAYVSADGECDLEIAECEAPHLEVSQDLELLAQEIAEAVVDDEKRSSGTPSPTLPRPSQTLKKEECSAEEVKEVRSTEQVEEECSAEQDHDTGGDESEKLRSSSPVDEASWVMVDAEEQEEDLTPKQDGHTKSPEQRFTVFRKFLARGDLKQKLTDIGLICDGCHDEDSRQQERLTLHVNDMVVSCSESMVICDLPQEEGNDNTVPDTVVPSAIFLKDPPNGPPLPDWRGTFSGARVMVTVERQAGLLVAGVRVWHVDLLSALRSLQHVVSSTGLISYADVDVPSLLARAA